MVFTNTTRKILIENKIMKCTNCSSVLNLIGLSMTKANLHARNLGWRLYKTGPKCPSCMSTEELFSGRNRRGIRKVDVERELNEKPELYPNFLDEYHRLLRKSRYGFWLHMNKPSEFNEFYLQYCKTSQFK